MTDETRRHVLRVVERVGYEPNISARVLAGRVRPQLAAVVATSAGSRGAARLLDAVDRATRRSGFALTIVSVEPSDPTSRTNAVDRLGEPGVAGVVLISSGVLADEQLRAVQTSAPCIALSAVPSGGVRAVGGDPAEAAMLAVDHLARLGHRSIAHIVIENDAGERFDPVRPALAARGLSGVALLHSSATSQAGFRFGRDAALHESCTALVAPTASFALGVIRGLGVRGIRVPADFSVVSLEDHDDAAHFCPPLTAIGSPAGELAEFTVATLLHSIGEGPPWPDPIPQPRLVHRATTGPSGSPQQADGQSEA